LQSWCGQTNTEYRPTAVQLFTDFQGSALSSVAMFCRRSRPHHRETGYATYSG